MREKLTGALKEAMVAKEPRRLCTLRLISAAIKDRDIANRGLGKERVADEDILEILAKMVKQREESATMFEEGGRLELAEREREEMEIIREFMPEQLCDEDVKQACAEVVAEVEASSLRDMGKCMGKLKERYPGKMDFGKASSVVKELLQ